MLIKKLLTFYKFERLELISRRRFSKAQKTDNINIKQNSQLFKLNNQAGLSIIEIIIAVALFIIVAGGATIAVLGSFSSTRLAKEELRAALLAEEGLEAVQSIRNQDWDNLNAGTYGLSNGGGSWIFSGSSDVDDSGRFTRVITISSVQRDGNGDVVALGGTVDDQTFLVNAAVSWSFTPTRNNTVELNQYLTNWQLSEGTGAGGGGGDTTTCADYCITQSYSAGTCRPAAPPCATYGETNEVGGNQYCTGGPSADTCCCAP